MIRTPLFALGLMLGAGAFAQDVLPVATPELGSRQATSPSRDTTLIGKHDADITGHAGPDRNRTNHARAPAGATARCRDDSYSFYQDRRDACCHHRCVAKWL